MTITKSYNKYTKTWYAYESVYVWDEKLQKKVQKRKCIGKYEPDETGIIVPTNSPGRPKTVILKANSTENFSSPCDNKKEIKRDEKHDKGMKLIISKLTSIDNQINKISSDLKELCDELTYLLNEETPKS